eukprot:194110-Chlamydomonas_euryale.AAC.4
MATKTGASVADIGWERLLHIRDHAAALLPGREEGGAMQRAAFWRGWLELICGQALPSGLFCAPSNLPRFLA